MTSKSLHSAYWYRVGNLQPRVQPGVSPQRQVLRMEEWFLFAHPVSGRNYRLNRKTYELVARLDGKQTIDALWNGLQEKFGDEAPTQDEVIATLMQLTEAGILLFDTPPDWPALNEANEAQRTRERSAALNPFAFKVRLFDPAPLLNRMRLAQVILFHPVTILCWVVVVSWALTRVLLEWDAIRSYAALHILTPRQMLLAWFVFPVMKALHELGHAFAIRRWGGDVKETGVTFFLLVPAPYVDASAATVFPGKWHRIAVSAAGIFVELGLAAIGFFLWASVENGLVRDIAFVVMVIGGVSTIVFNGNPLMRFDGYYILCDLLELPNLASRSQRLWATFVQRYISGTQQDVLSSQLRAGEFTWLLLYSPIAWCYRLSVSIAILLFVSAKSAFLGLLATLWIAYGLFIRPVWKGLFVFFGNPSHPAQERWSASLRAGGVVLALVAMVLWVPVPDNTVAAGLVWLPEQAQIRSKSTGQIVEIIANDGQRVAKGDVLVVMEEPALLAEIGRTEAKIRSLQTEQMSTLLTESARSGNATLQLERLRSDLTQMSERVNELTLRAEVDGVFVLPHRDEMLGRHLQKGTLIAHVIPGGPTTVRAVVPQNDEGRIRAGVKSVSVWPVEENGERLDANLLRESPAATYQLPSAALGDRAGGRYITDPADRDGLTSLEPLFVVDVQTPQWKSDRIGGRAWIRFEHKPVPLGNTIAWHFQQLFLKLFRADLG